MFYVRLGYLRIDVVVYTFTVRYRLPKVVSPTEHCKANVLLKDALCSVHDLDPPGREPRTPGLQVQCVDHYNTQPNFYFSSPVVDSFSLFKRPLWSRWKKLRI